MAIQRKQCLYLMLAIVFFMTGQSHLAHGAAVIPGDARTEEYLPLLSGKRVALFCNQTARIGEEHILDVLLKEGQYVAVLFFRNMASGETFRQEKQWIVARIL